jgi:hypothetical protein
MVSGGDFMLLYHVPRVNNEVTCDFDYDLSDSKTGRF